jgi:hypothetical protein
MLQAKRFGGSEAQFLSAANAFWQDFKQAVDGIIVGAEGDFRQMKGQRLIRFFDTASYHLNSGQYIFRERVDLESGKREVTLKFRHPDRNIAQDRNMDAKEGDEPQTKFEEDIKGPFISLYSFSTTQRIGEDKNLNKLKDIMQMFPDIADRLDDFPEADEITVVNSFTAREVVLGGPSMQLGKSPKIEAECALIAWYDHDHDDEPPVVIEFSYRYGDKNEDYNGNAARRAFKAFNTLQTRLRTWVDPKAPTKTALVYRIKTGTDDPLSGD